MKIRYLIRMATSLLRQTLQGLAFLNTNNITYRDFQTSNMLFTLKDYSSVR